VSLRLRLTLLYALLLAAGLVVFSVGVYVVARQRIYNAVDSDLHDQANIVVAALQPLDTPLTQADVNSRRSEFDDAASIGAIFQIRDPQGRVLYSSAEPVGRNLPAPPQGDFGEPSYVTSDVQGRHFRILFVGVVRNGQTLAIVEHALSLKQTDGALAEIREVLIIGGAAILLITGGFTYALAWQALDPVRELSRLASDIERTADFSKRLQPRGGAEMKEFIETFNAMTRRVEKALLSQREFLADSSHELRRPLAVLRANIDVLNDPGIDQDQREACLREMSVDAERMGRLLSDLLLLSREEGQAIDRALVDYTTVCRDAVARLKAQDNQHEVRVAVDDGVRLRGDKERLSQMLSNLLDNAAWYTPTGGRIELKLSCTDHVARVEVRDSGQGIPEGELPHIFERFYRGDRARAIRGDGTGLGLSIVKYIAEAHGGSVIVSSEPDSGSAFIVDLPAAS
jgi:two-component system OmpR family sensor kinase